MDLDPQFKAMLDMQAAAPPLPAFSAGTVAEARAIFDRMQAGLPADRGPRDVNASELRIPGDERDIPARSYRFGDDEPIATIVYLRGSGWVVGDLDAFDPVCRLLARESACEVVNIGYRLAPEHPFPAALDDACASVHWAASQNRPVVVMGDSAGGNLAAACALRLRDEGATAPAFQVLIYPVTDHDFTTNSYHTRGELEVTTLSRADMEWFWHQYVPDVSGRSDSYVSPLRAPDLRALPPVLMLIAGYDPLYDEGASYAERLNEAGVKIDLWRYENMPHGFFSMVDVLDAANSVVARVAQYVRAAVLTPS